MFRAKATRGAIRHDEPLFPERGDVSRSARGVGAGRTTPEPARQAAESRRGDLQPLPAILTIEQAIAAGSFLTEPLRLTRGDVSAITSSALRYSRASWRSAARSISISRRRPPSRGSTRAAACQSHSSTQHPSETQEIVARVLGSADAPGDGRVPPHGRRVRRQGSAGQRVCGDRRARRVENPPAGTRPADPRARHGADRQAASVPRPVHRRLCRRRPHRSACVSQLYSDGGWSLDLSEPIMWRSLFHCDNAYHLPAVEATGRVCRTHKTSQTAFRGFGGPQGDGRHRRDPVAGGAPAVACPPTSSASATSIARARRPTTARRSTMPARIATIWHAAEGHERRSTRAAPAIDALQRARTAHASAAWRSRR